MTVKTFEEEMVKKQYAKVVTGLSVSLISLERALSTHSNAAEYPYLCQLIHLEFEA